jgi:hypothetical protein
MVVVAESKSFSWVSLRLAKAGPGADRLVFWATVSLSLGAVSVVLDHLSPTNKRRPHLELLDDLVGLVGVVRDAIWRGVSW